MYPFVKQNIKKEISLNLTSTNNNATSLKDYNFITNVALHVSYVANKTLYIYYFVSQPQENSVRNIGMSFKTYLGFY